jgi:hypothetical protein
LKRILGALERRQSNKLYGLPEFGEIIGSFLHLLQAVSNRIGLVDDLEDL